MIGGGGLARLDKLRKKPVFFFGCLPKGKNAEIIERSVNRSFCTAGHMENTPGSVWKLSGLGILRTTPTFPRGPSNPERQVSTYHQIQPFSLFPGVQAQHFIPVLYSVNEAAVVKHKKKNQCIVGGKN